MSIKIRLDSWKEIAMYLKRDVRTVQRWYTNRRLPVHHVPGSRYSSVFAYAAELDEWLNSTLGNGAHVPSGPRPHSSALEVMELWGYRSEDNIHRIIELCHKAIVEDPHSVDAFGMLACAYIWSAYGEFMPASRAFLCADMALRKALSMGPMSASVSSAQAWLTLCSRRNYALAEVQFRKCLAAFGDQSFTLNGLAMTCLIKHDFDEAIDLVTRAHNIDPLSPSVSYWFLSQLYYTGNFKQVIAEARTARFIAHETSALCGKLGLAYAALGREEESLKELREAANKYPESMFVRGALGYAIAVFGHREEAEGILAKLIGEQPNLKACSAYATALVCAGLHDVEQTLRWIKKGEEDFSLRTLFLELDPAFAFLRNDDRFKAIADEMRRPKND